MEVQRFYLDREQDESGVSGTGVVAVGVRMPSGRVVMEWLATAAGPGVMSIGVYESLEAVEKVHGHRGATRIRFF